MSSRPTSKVKGGWYEPSDLAASSFDRLVFNDIGMRH